MAGPIQTKLQKISGQYSSKVAEIRKLEADKRKPFVTDADTKVINTKIKQLDKESDDLINKLNELGKLEKTAEEYLDLNKKIKEIEASITKANARGEDIVAFTQQKNKALGRLGQISPEVEKNFPEIRIAKPSTVTPAPRENLKGDKGLLAQESAAKGVNTPVVTPAPVNTPPVKPPVKNPTKSPIKKTPAEVKPVVDREAEALNVAAGQDFTLPETLFKNIPSLNALLKKYVSTPGMTPDAFRKMLRDDVWYKQNSKEIKERFIQYYNYRDLQASGQAKGTTDYEMQIDKIEAMLKKRATQLGSAAASDPAALRKAAENLYITNRSEDQSFIDDFLAASIRPVGGMLGGKGTEGYSGKALSDYQLILETARKNGFQIKDILPGGATEQQILQGITMGTIDINRILQDARKLAAQGQPQYVRDLLSQGYNLDQVYAPYREQMARELDLNPNEIDLNDPTLRMAITDKGDMNLYDFKKALRQDNRWQYTETAKEEVSNAALKVLQDFGFQG